ncbi:MAG TPA: guanylate kinase [Candidatus Avimonas sp.]|jgi:guanylate kinase|nr:guanylate kinase [Clostridiales bacterium]HOB35898.1 guanylate kinase [Candidatus Avimonas sp.]HQA15370.1 guanylate kinase [Candidatus Avimonas sp.]HQD37330.1 guanylate kinase [Candidatus Avimonas sp.]
MNNRGMLIILSGPSGSGKGTIVRQLLKQRDDTVLSVSVTTRAPRTGEREGVHYYFKTKQEFERLIENGELLEYAEYNGDYYGTPVKPVEKCVREGKNVILEIEVQGAEKVMDKREDIVSIFITAPSLTELERRLRRRGSETDASIEQRLKIARWELTRAFRYDYVVLNDEVPLAVERIQAIISAESMRFARMENFILEVINNA